MIQKLMVHSGGLTGKITPRLAQAAELAIRLRAESISLGLRMNVAAAGIFKRPADQEIDAALPCPDTGQAEGWRHEERVRSANRTIKSDSLKRNRQRAQLGRVADVLILQGHGHDLPAAGIHAEVQLASCAPGARVLFCRPLAGAIALQSGAVGQDVQRLSRQRPTGDRFNSRRSSAAGRVIRNRDLAAQQRHHRQQQPFGLAQREFECHSQPPGSIRQV
jgi:hypothetical protein